MSLSQNGQKCAWCDNNLYCNEEIADYNGNDIRFIGWKCHDNCNLDMEESYKSGIKRSSSNIEEDNFKKSNKKVKVWEDNYTLDYPPPFKTMGYVTYKRTYARRLDPNDVNSPVESWEQTLNRVIRACRNQLKCGFTQEEEKTLYEYMYNLKGLPAGRFMWQLGTETVDRLGPQSLQNCAFVKIDSPITPFTQTFNLLMLGSGVGIRVLPSDVYSLPQVNKCCIKRKDTKDADYIVSDSREGWVKLLGKVLKSHFYSGKGFTYSLMLIRGKGEPIRLFGGIASGPKVLEDGIEKIHNLLNNIDGRKISPTEAMDIIDMIGEVVVSGNVRRSAILVLGDANDKEYIASKRWDKGTIPNWRAFSNNSVVVDKISDLLENETFWDGYMGKGEPFGLINLKLSRTMGKLGEKKDDPLVEGYNPCVTSDTWIMTEYGPQQVSDIIGKQIKLYVDGKLYETTEKGFWKTRECEVYHLKTKEGFELKLTGNHKVMLTSGSWKTTEDLVVGDKVRIHQHKELDWKGDGGNCIEGYNNTDTDFNKFERYSKDYYNGLLSSDVICNNHKTTQRMLLRLGHYSKIVNGKLILIHHDHSTVTSVTKLKGNVPVYDCTVPNKGAFDANGFYVSNCAEQPLANNEVCCLSETFLPNIKSEEELHTILRLLYRICKHSLLLPFHNDPKIQKIVRHNLRIGCGITGYLQATETQKQWLPKASDMLTSYDIEYSKKIGVNPSIRLTTVKPSGTMSILGSVTPGAHPGFARYYIRRIRFASNSPLIKILKDSGYHTEFLKRFDNSEDHNTIIVEFPERFPDDTVIAEDCTAIDQLEYVKRLQKDWSNNAVSCTIYYKLEELPAIKNWLRDNFDNCVKSVSFLLHAEYHFKQMPLEKLSKEEYQKKIAVLKPLNMMKNISLSKDDETFIGENECNGGACPMR
jgi:ribonucleotide reductase alpha subunit